VRTAGKQLTDYRSVVFEQFPQKAEVETKRSVGSDGIFTPVRATMGCELLMMIKPQHFFRCSRL